VIGVKVELRIEQPSTAVIAAQTLEQHGVVVGLGQHEHTEDR
jgi:hypothetical protein